jgi:hypothetical protein
VRHAREGTLDRLEALLAELRAVPGLREKKRGVFYRRSKAFLHFHEDPTGLYADVRLDEEFERLRVTTGEERAALLALVRAAG